MATTGKPLTIVSVPVACANRNEERPLAAHRESCSAITTAPKSSCVFQWNSQFDKQICAMVYAMPGDDEPEAIWWSCLPNGSVTILSELNGVRSTIVGGSSSGRTVAGSPATAIGQQMRPLMIFVEYRNCYPMNNVQVNKWRARTATVCCGNLD